MRLLSHIPAARRFMAETAEEANVAYRTSPISVGRRLRHAKVAAGEHVPHVVDAEVQKQLAAVCGGQNTGHVVLAVAAGQPAPAAGDGEVQVLVTAHDTHVSGYDTVIDDPKVLVAQRFGLRNGERVVIRADGYIGAVATLDDTTTVADYFAKIRS